MMKPDQFCEHYGDLVDSAYDCVDRLVVNAYFILGQSPGGFRTWWRTLHGSDENLDNTHLMRYAGRFARRVHAYAKAKGIPLRQCMSSDPQRKYQRAEELIPEDPGFEGVFCILYGRAPAPVREVRRSDAGITQISTKTPLPYVNHYYFHILDRQWGHVTIRFCPHPPFNAQVILNGHEYVARQAQGAGISFRKDGNCFTEASNAAGLARIADTMRAPGSEGRLVQVCERWMYSSCVCFALEVAEQQASGFRYSYSVYQGEYSRNYVFGRGRKMEQVFHSLIDRTRVCLDIRTLKTIFGVQRRPYSRRGKAPRIELAVERPTYDLTVFKIHFGILTLKMYTKGEGVLRVETIVHNARRLDCGCRIDKLAVIVEKLRVILTRFVDTLRCVDASFLDARRLETWPRPSKLQGRPVAGLDLNAPRMQAVTEAVIALCTTPDGFKASDLAERVCVHPPAGIQNYSSRQASYDLRKLRAKRVVRRIPGTLRYESMPTGLRSIMAFHILRNKVLVPLLANAGERPRSPHRHMLPIDVFYDNIQREMQHVFQALGLSA